MKMFRKYEKTFHMESNGLRRDLAPSEVSQLLNGIVVIEEKLDGANAGIIRHKKGFSLQKRNSLMETRQHSQFGFFQNWANVNYEKILKVPIGMIIYGELLYSTHTIYYENLPEYFLVFDVFSKNSNNYLNFKERQEFCEKYNFPAVPVIAIDRFSKNEILKMVPRKGTWSAWAEGIFVKRYSKNNYYKAKIVDSHFIKQLEEDEHWMDKPSKRNGLVQK